MLRRRFNLCFVVSILIIILVSIIFSFTVLAEKLPEKIVIGCLEPLTGAHAIFGSEAKIGMEFALQHINEA
jgi:branched-chain amino acid transport system substrate-binding protein